MDPNPYAPPASPAPWPPPAAPTSPAPAYALYSPGSVVLAGFLGSPLAGTILLYLNRKRLGRAREGRVVLLVGVVATVVLFALGWVLPAHAGNFLPIAAIIPLRSYAQADQPTFAAHLAAGGRKESGWKAAGLGLGVLVLVLAALIPFAVGADLFAHHRVDFGNAQQITYEEGTTEADARKLGAYLKEAEFFSDTGKGKDVELGKSGEAIVVSFVVGHNAWEKPELVQVFESMRVAMAAQVFPGTPVIVDLVDDELVVQKSLKDP